MSLESKLKMKKKLFFYNTLGRELQEFKPLDSENKKVGLYGCGPTVYWNQHIGNLRRYVFEDVLDKVLRYNGYDVKHVINVTDVGHLVSDADTGEDKMEKASQKEGRSAKEIAKDYFDKFVEDLNKLNISKPDIWAWATEHIPEQIDLVKKLEEKGYTYKTKDGIYFDTSKINDYGKLANLKEENIEAGKRINLGEKKNKTDFALWKFSEEPGKRQQEWDSPWGIGYPGWHVECSAMSSKYLGKQFDIHTGGMDHIQIHHTNEIAQSESAFGKKPWVKYWLHSGFLKFENGKLSKSKGKILTISNLEEKGFHPLEFRYMCLSALYRKPLDFSIENLEKAKNAYSRLKKKCLKLEESEEVNEKYLDEFNEAVNNNLNVPKALQVLWNLVRNEKAKNKYGTIKKMEEVLSLDLFKEEKIEIPNNIMELVKERETARAKKEFKKADELREVIEKQGYSINDTEKGAEVELK